MVVNTFASWSMHALSTLPAMDQLDQLLSLRSLCAVASSVHMETVLTGLAYGSEVYREILGTKRSESPRCGMEWLCRMLGVVMTWSRMLFSLV